MHPATIYHIYLISAAIIVIVTVVLCWPMRDLPSYWRFEYGLIICALLMIPQYMWYHMLSLLFIPLVIIVEYLWSRQRWNLLALVLAFYATTTLHGIFFRHTEFTVSRWLTLFPFLFMLVMWLLLGWIIRVEKRAERAIVGGGVEMFGSLSPFTPAGNGDRSGSSVAQ
jgi:hypothetical protein